MEKQEIDPTRKVEEHPLTEEDFIEALKKASQQLPKEGEGEAKDDEEDD